MNKNKIISIVAGIVVILIVVSIVAAQNKRSDNDADDYASSTLSTTSQGSETINPGATTTRATGTAATGTASGGTSKTYAAATIAAHNSASSCWTIVNGSVYDVTTFITKHPGGQQAIVSLCGKDGTSAFTTQHGGQTRPEAALASFKIGVIAR